MTPPPASKRRYSQPVEPRTAPTQIAFVEHLADSLAGANTLEELVRPLLEMLAASTGLEATYMTTIDEAAGVQQVRYSRTEGGLEIPEGLSVPWEDTLCRRALMEGRMYTDDVAAHWGDSAAARELGISTYASTPIHGSDGALYGTLCAASNRRLPMREDARRVLDIFSRLIGHQMQRERLMQELQAANDRLRRYALTDAVTGLPNRRALTEELQRRLARRARDGSDVLVAFVDLDGFKQVNDTYGHDAGDRMLVAIAELIAQAHRADDYAARLGGDEFVVLANAASNAPGAADALRERLQQATTTRIDLGEHQIDYGGASVGVVVATRGRDDPQAELIRADAAMYAAKRKRRRARKARQVPKDR